MAKQKGIILILQSELEVTVRSQEDEADAVAVERDLLKAGLYQRQAKSETK